VPEIDLRHAESHVRLYNFSDNDKLRVDPMLRNLEVLVDAVIISDRFGSLFEEHFELFARQNNAFVVGTLEEVGTDEIIHHLLYHAPAELLLLGSGVHHPEALRVLDLGADRRQLNDTQTRIDVFARSLHLFPLFRRL
jgi:hypothetical protein